VQEGMTEVTRNQSVMQLSTAAGGSSPGDSKSIQGAGARLSAGIDDALSAELADSSAALSSDTANGPATDVLRGTVKFFDSRRGYGFLKASPTDAVEIFVHYTDIVGEGFRSLDHGARVCVFRLLNGLCHRPSCRVQAGHYCRRHRAGDAESISRHGPKWSSSSGERAKTPSAQSGAAQSNRSCDTSQKAIACNGSKF